MKDGAIIEVTLPVLWNQNLSNRRRRSTRRKRSNRWRAIRGFGSQSREKSMKEEDQLTEVKTSILRLSGLSWRPFLLKDLNQADDCDLTWLVELLPERVLASSSWASLMQWKGAVDYGGRSLSVNLKSRSFLNLYAERFRGGWAGVCRWKGEQKGSAMTGFHCSPVCANVSIQ